MFEMLWVRIQGPYFLQRFFLKKIVLINFFAIFALVIFPFEIVSYFAYFLLLKYLCVR